jgi:outer membrane lipoprotein carrier protein
MRTFNLVAALVAAAGTVISAAQPSSPSAAEVASAVQTRYDAIRDFTADFVHESQGGLLGKKRTERGTLHVKKPGRMRWDYTAPEKKVFVSDGKKTYLYVPADKQVLVTSVPPADEATTAVLFLVGRGSITRDFTVSFMAGGGPDTYSLKLQPKLPERDYDWLQLVVERATMRIRMLAAADAQGGRQTFNFSNFKENVGLADKTFEFKPPRGTDVVYPGAPSR